MPVIKSHNSTGLPEPRNGISQSSVLEHENDIMIIGFDLGGFKISLSSQLISKGKLIGEAKPFCFAGAPTVLGRISNTCTEAPSDLRVSVNETGYEFAIA